MSKESCEKNRIAQLRFWAELSVKEREKRRLFHSNIALNNLEKSYRKTGIEIKIENLLQDLNLKYKYSFILKNRQFDFLLFDKKIIIECHGDYWHGNPSSKKVIKNGLSERQKMKQIDDNIKEKIANENGYKYIFFWEKDINENLSFIKNKLIKLNECTI